MPQMTSLVLKDGASTPANHTYVPRESSQGVATFVESTGVPIGERRLTVGMSRTQNGRIKATIKLAVPAVQDSVVAGVSRPSVVRTAYADLTFAFDGTSSKAERDDALALLVSALGLAPVKAVITDLENMY